MYLVFAISETCPAISEQLKLTSCGFSTIEINTLPWKYRQKNVALWKNRRINDKEPVIYTSSGIIEINYTPVSTV
jgi:hypothetical protein